MIEFYLKNKLLNTESKINECFNYYKNDELLQDNYERIYREYDRVLKSKPKNEYDQNNEFFKNSKLKNKIKTVFMKECLLESLKRYIEYKTDEDIINRVKYDIYYLENWSLILDLNSVFLTTINFLTGQKKAY